MTTTPETGDQPDFSAAAAAPEPRPEGKPVEEVDGESIAVPAGDLTGAITAAIEEATGEDDDES